ncbi:MAG: hypothetical protein R3C17_08760 [Planctomycetaceae bacterium]
MDLEFKVPGIIFGVSLAVLIGWACIYPAQDSIGIALLAVTLSLGVNVILGVVALFVAAALFNMSFGELRSAYLKLGAIFAAPAAATSIIPNAAIGWVVSLGLYFGLLSWLFDLDGKDVLISTIVLAVVRWLTLIVTVLILVGLLHATN